MDGIKEKPGGLGKESEREEVEAPQHPDTQGRGGDRLNN